MGSVVVGVVDVGLYFWLHVSRIVRFGVFG